MSTKQRRQSAIVALLAAALALILAIPATASAEPFGSITRFGEAAGLRPAASPHDVVLGPDGNVWVQDVGTNSLFQSLVERVTPGGEITEFVVPGSPAGMTVGSDGNLWFAQQTGGVAIDKMTTSGTVTPYSEGLNPAAAFGEVTTGPDGNVWFTDYAGHAIGKVTPSGQITMYSAGLQPGNTSRPMAISTGPDGNVWFTDIGASDGGINEIGKVDLSTEPPTIEEFGESKGLNTGSIPGGAEFASEANGLAPGPDGNVWFTDIGTTKAIGRITPSGEIKEFSTGLQPASRPSGLAAGPHGTLWFTDGGGTNEVQNVKLEGGPTGGSFKLGFEGQTTGAKVEGTLSSESTSVTGVSLSSGTVVKEELIEGAGIKAGTKVSACSPTVIANICTAPTSITLSQKTESGASGATPLTLNLPLGASSTVVKNALRALPTVGSQNLSDVNVSGSSPTYTVTFVQALGQTNVPPLECDASGLTGGTPACSVETTTQGKAGKVGRVDPSTEPPTIEEFEGPGGTTLHGLVTGADGNLWMGVANKIARFWINTGPTNRATLTITKSGNGPGGTGSVSSKPKGIKCGTTCTEAVAAMYKKTPVELTEKPATGSTFLEWTGACSGSSPTCTVPMEEDESVGAVFTGASKTIAPAETLTLSKGEGSGHGTVKASGLACEAECTQTKSLYQGPTTKPGKVVILKQAPAFGSVFSGWTGCTEISETECEVKMESAKEVTAEYEALPNKVLTINKAYAKGNGSVSSKPKGIKCGTTCTQAVAQMPEGASVELVAKPTTGTFVKWSNPGGDCNESTSTVCIVGLDKDETLEAVFSEPGKAIAEAKTLTLNKEGSGFGTVKASGLACEVLCSSTKSLYQGPTTKPGKVVILKAISAPGTKAVEWTGCTVLSPSECGVKMEADKTVTATFEEIE